MHKPAQLIQTRPALNATVKALMLASALGLSSGLHADQQDNIAFENQQMILQMLDRLQSQIDDLKQNTVRRDQFELLKTRVGNLTPNVPVPIAPPKTSAQKPAPVDPTPVAYEARDYFTQAATNQLGSDDSASPSSNSSLSELFGYGGASQAPAKAAPNSAAQPNSLSQSAQSMTPAQASQYAQAQAALNSSSTPRAANTTPSTTNLGANASTGAPNQSAVNSGAAAASSYNPPIYNYGAPSGSTTASTSTNAAATSNAQLDNLRRQISVLQRQQAKLAAGGGSSGVNTLKRDIERLKRDQQQLSSLSDLPGQVSLLSGLPAQVASLEGLPSQFDQLQTQVNDLDNSLENSLFELADLKNSTEARYSEVKRQLQLANTFPTWMKWAMFGLGLLALIAGLTALFAAARQRKKIKQLKDSLERDLLRVEDRIESSDPIAAPTQDMDRFKDEIMALVAAKIAAQPQSRAAQPASTAQPASKSDFLASTSAPSALSTERAAADTSPYHLQNATRKPAAPSAAPTPAAADQTLSPRPLSKISDDDLDTYLPDEDEYSSDIDVLDFEDEPVTDSSPSDSLQASQSAAKDTLAAASVTSAAAATSSAQSSDKQAKSNTLDLSAEFTASEPEPNADTTAMLLALDQETKSERVQRDWQSNQSSEPVANPSKPLEFDAAPREPAQAATKVEADPVAPEHYAQASTSPAESNFLAASDSAPSPEKELEKPAAPQPTVQPNLAPTSTQAPLEAPKSATPASTPASKTPQLAAAMPRPTRPSSRQQLSTPFDHSIDHERASANSSDNSTLAAALLDRAEHFSGAQEVQRSLSDYNELIKHFSTSHNPDISSKVSQALIDSTRLELTRTGTISASRLAQGKSFFSADSANRAYMESMELLRAAQRRDVSTELRDLKNVYSRSPKLDYPALNSWAQTLKGGAATRVTQTLEQLKNWGRVQAS